MTMTKSIVISLSLLFLLNSTGYSQGNNLREECRLRVGGLHLQLRDSVELSKKRMKRLTYQNKMMSLKVKDIDKTIEANRAAQKKDKLNFDLKEEETYSLNRRSQLTTFMERNQAQIDGIKITILGNEEKLENWINKLSPAYRLKKYPGKESMGYPYEIVYFKPCPNFLDSCPLRKNAKKSVKALFEGYPFPKVCERYLQQN